MGTYSSPFAFYGNATPLLQPITTRLVDSMHRPLQTFLLSLEGLNGMLMAMSTNEIEQTPNEGRFTSPGDYVALDDSCIRAMLHKGTVGTLALTRDAQPVLFSGLYVYDEVSSTIYLHITESGSIQHEALEQACFGVSAEDASVVVYGAGALLTNVVESKRAHELLLAKYLNHTHLTADLANIPPYRIQIERWTGRQKQRLGGMPTPSQPQSYPN